MIILFRCSERGCHVDQRAAMAAPPKPVRAAPPALREERPHWGISLDFHRPTPSPNDLH